MNISKLHGIPEPSLLALLLLVSYPSVGAVLFTPALPIIAESFHITSGLAQLTVTLFLIGYALGQLPYGPLSNKIGRKPALYTGLTISIFGALLCGLAGLLNQLWLLLLARIIAALGASVGLMMALTIVSDYYEPEMARKKLSLVIIAFAIAPGAAVALGGLLTEIMGWESTFYFQALYGLLLWLICIQLPETSTTLNNEPFNLKWIIDSYLKRCNNAKLVVCSFIQGSCTSFVYIFAALAPFMVIHILGFSPTTYGLLSLIPSIGMIVGSLLSHYTHHLLSPQKSILLGLLLIFPANIAMLCFFMFGIFNLWTLFIPYFFMNIGITLAYINCPTIGTGSAKNKPNASAVLAFINISMCVITVFILEIINSSNPLWMPILFAALLTLLFPFYVKLEKMIASV
ncbi:MAG: MFS transporter [Ignavibacteriae bacterium]|nr:MFS transporter [Ignavibacteriota bacterium]